MINVREKNEMKQQKAYLGAVIQYGEKKEIIPLIQPGSAMEYALSKAIKKLTVNEKATVGLLQGHGEPSIQEIIQIYTELSVLYNVEPLTLSDTGNIPEHIKTIAIIKPKDTIPSAHFAQMDAFLAKGGKMLIAAGRSNADLQKAYVSSFSNGLENWLNTKGIIIGNDIVVDAKCAQIQVQQQQGGLRYISTINFPYIPIISNFAKHSISGGLEAVVMQFPSSIEFTSTAGKTFTPIAFTSDKANTENLPLYFNAQKQWNEADFPRKKIVIAGILEGNLSVNTPSKMVIIADGDFAINGERQSAQQLQPDNVNFFVNSIDWLSDATGLIDLRTKSVTSRPIKEMEDSSKTFLKYLNFLLPIMLVIGYGFFKFQVNRNKRIKRMEESYV
jgi:gliding-associated putative ABC transporter substrate-binding component GldG